jgi:hypothetical protein
MNGSRKVLAGLTEGRFAPAGAEVLPEGEEISRAGKPLSSTVDGIPPAREEMPRAKKSLSSTVDGHSSAIPCASTGESSTVTLRGGASWERWKGSSLSVPTVGIEELSNDTGLGASSGGMRASSRGGVIVIGSFISERPGGLGIEIGEQRSCSSRE